jgi:hypothetical protein
VEEREHLPTLGGIIIRTALWKKQCGGSSKNIQLPFDPETLVSFGGDR